MMDVERALIQFHAKFRHWMEETPITPPSEVVELRKKLIWEEHEELQTAILENNLVEIADACADLVYVVVGTCVSYGIPFNAVFHEVHRSNMTKSMLKDEKSVKGKTLKGPDYSPPNIKRAMYGNKESS